MNNVLVVIREGKNLNETLASILYDRYGSKTKQQTLICKDWDSGIQQAREYESESVLFVDSGTVFNDSDQPRWHIIIHQNCEHPKFQDMVVNSYHRLYNKQDETSHSDHTR